MNQNGQIPILPENARWDDRVLHFLINLPAWVIIAFAIMFLVSIWMRTAAQNIERLIDMAVASLFTAIVGNRRAGNNVDNSINTDTIKTPQVKTDLMKDTQINVSKDTQGESEREDDPTNDVIPQTLNTKKDIE